jgi:hypothetical protein
MTILFGQKSSPTDVPNVRCAPAPSLTTVTITPNVPKNPPSWFSPLFGVIDPFALELNVKFIRSPETRAKTLGFFLGAR